MSATTSTQSYSGPERRRHRVFVTGNSEYHCRDGVCVAVRNRSSGEYQRDHSAIGRRLSGSMRLTPDGIASASPPDHPGIGEKLCFSSGDLDDPHNILTSSLLRVARPPREALDNYH